MPWTSSGTRQAGWTTTSPEEQADDAAALLNELGIGPVAVFGTSCGGNFALYMLIRHPEVVRGAILHLRDTATTLFIIELGTYELCLPDSGMLTAIQIPVRLLVIEQSLPSSPRSRADSHND
jgi:pimeloyl-ACP methyl ester carboxylesterase